MIPADELVARADTNTSWDSMMTHELAEEILERSITREEWDVIRDTLDDNVYETLMSFR
jgi:hypothetical protein